MKWGFLLTNNESVNSSKKIGALLPYIAMALIILTVQVGSLWLSATDYIPSQPPIGDSEDVRNSIYYIAVFLIFSVVIVYLIKKKHFKIIRGLIYVAIGFTLFYTISAIFSKVVVVTNPIVYISLGLAVLFVILLYKFPEWYIIDFAGLLISIGACAVLGISLSYVPIIILMVALLIYDFISVYKTKHMVTLARGMMNLKLPILFVIPKKLSYSFVNDDFSDDLKSEKTDSESETEVKSETQAESETQMKSETQAASETPSDSDISAASDTGEKKSAKSDALFMGLGDAVIPTLLVVSANHFLPSTGFVSVPALATMVGTFIGFIVLMYFVSSGKPQAGLPCLNTGAILGFGAGFFLIWFSIF